MLGHPQLIFLERLFAVVWVQQQHTMACGFGAHSAVRDHLYATHNYANHCLHTRSARIFRLYLRKWSQAAAALVSVIMRSSALENQHLFDFLARSNAVLS